MDRQTDKHDEQFETFLRQFKLRKPSAMPEMTSGTRGPVMRWFLAAAVVTLVVAGSALMIRNLRNGGSPLATVEAAGTPSLYRSGEAIEAGRAIQANSAVGLVLALRDGSHVEMRSQSQLALESASDGMRIRLDDGSILVTAAKQGSGHLYVQTRDSLVSVVGTVFFVSTEPMGTRVAVVEGEVHVQQGAELTKLLPGEQVGSNPSFTLKPVAEQIAWSRNAAKYVAMLQQPVLALPTPQQQAATPAPVRPDALLSLGSKKNQEDLLEYLTALAQLRLNTQAPAVPASAPPTSTKPEENSSAKEDPDTAGARILNTACTTCHDLGAITRHTEDKPYWETIVNGMVGYGADVKDTDISVLADYLFRYYGPSKEAPSASTTPVPPTRP